MLPTEFQLTTLPYVLLCAAATSVALKRKTASRLNAAMAVIVVLLLVKLAVESRLRPPNFYEMLGVHKASSVMQVHLAFKAVMSSFGLHSSLPPAFVQDARRIYEVLMESETRDVYNRFGEPGLLANVHADELQLITHIAAPYVLWLGVVLLTTMDRASRSCRPWVATAGIAVLIVDASLCTTQLSLPVDLPWLFPPTMTEYELRWKMHSVFGAVCMALRAAAIYRHFDAPGHCAEIVSLVHAQSGTVRKALQHVRAIATAHPDAADAASTSALVEEEKEGEELASIKDAVEQSWQGINALATAVHTHVNRPRRNYYWVLFGLLYVGVYLLGA